MGRWLAVLAGAAVLLATTALPALAAEISVATFDEDRPAPAGSTVERTVRVANHDDDELVVLLAPRGVELLDDGATRLLPGEDPRWEGRITPAEPRLVVPPRGSADVRVKIAIPGDLDPDEYLIAIVVSPLASRAGMVVATEAVALLAITVQGDRQRSLELVEHRAPRIVVGDHADGQVRVVNTGKTLVNAWIEASVVNAFTGSRVAVIQVHERTRVAPGASRDLSYTWQAGITGGRFRVPVRVSYNRTNATTAELDVEEELWLIHPAFLVVVAALGLVVVGWIARPRGSRRSAPARSRAAVALDGRGTARGVAARAASPSSGRQPRIAPTSYRPVLDRGPDVGPADPLRDAFVQTGACIAEKLGIEPRELYAICQIGDRAPDETACAMERRLRSRYRLGPEPPLGEALAAQGVLTADEGWFLDTARTLTTTPAG